MMNDAATDTSTQNYARRRLHNGTHHGRDHRSGVGVRFRATCRRDLRRSVAGTARNLGAAASDRYQDANARVGDAVEQLANKARAVRDDAADEVVSGAHDIARFAASTKS